MPVRRKFNRVEHKFSAGDREVVAILRRDLATLETRLIARIDEERRSRGITERDIVSNLGAAISEEKERRDRAVRGAYDFAAEECMHTRHEIEAQLQRTVTFRLVAAWRAIVAFLRRDITTFGKRGA